MRKEFYIPLTYTFIREELRSDLSLPESIIRAISNLLKHSIWIPILCLFHLNGDLSISIYGELFFNIILFSVLYEIGYIFVDNIGIKHENKKIRNVLYNPPISKRIVYTAIVIRILLTLLALLLYDHVIVNIFYAITFTVFISHGLLAEKYRVATFILLRMLKGTVPYLFMILMIPADYIILIYFAVFSDSIFFTMEYSDRKLYRFFDIDVYNDKNIWIKFILLLIILFIVTLTLRIPYMTLILIYILILVFDIIMALISRLKRLVLG